MRSEIVRFIDHHLLSWLREWNSKIQEGSETLCYKGIGTLIVAVTEDLRSVFSDSSSTGFTFNDIKN